MKKLIVVIVIALLFFLALAAGSCSPRYQCPTYSKAERDSVRALYPTQFSTAEKVGAVVVTLFIVQSVTDSNQ